MSIPNDSIKKIKAPIGDENGFIIYHHARQTIIKKIKAPIGDENLNRYSVLRFHSIY